MSSWSAQELDDVQRRDGECRVLVCCTGSVASLKVPELLAALRDSRPAGRVRLRLVSTASARHFFSAADVPSDVQQLTDADEWSCWRSRADPVLHIELRRWADLLLFAPLSANSLAKLSHGLADNLATCVARAWPLADKPAVVAPAMNTQMWQHPCTAQQLATLQQWGYTVLPPVRKTLVCGETGLGAMAHVADICDSVTRLLALNQPDSAAHDV